MQVSKTNWQKLKGLDNNYLSVVEFDDGQGGLKDLVLEIEDVKQEEVTSNKGRKETKTVVLFKGAKPLILNKTNAKTISAVLRSEYIEDWQNKKIKLFYNPDVTFGRKKVGGIRVRPERVEEEKPELKCTNCQKTIEPYKGITPEQIAKASKQSFGIQLCYDCSVLAKKAGK